MSKLWLYFKPSKKYSDYSWIRYWRYNKFNFLLTTFFTLNIIYVLWIFYSFSNTHLRRDVMFDLSRTVASGVNFSRVNHGRTYKNIRWRREHRAKPVIVSQFKSTEERDNGVNFTSKFTFPRKNYVYHRGVQCCNLQSIFSLLKRWW